MTTKNCIKCGDSKPLDDYYKHSRMSDGHLNKCKKCCRLDAIANRRKRVDYYRAYDKARAATDRRKMRLADRQRRYRSSNSAKAAARCAVYRAVLSGRLCRHPCEVCGAVEVDGHHDDYSQPLRVRWLCRKHHLIEHRNYVTVSG
jgi:hypothetical protein